MTKQVLLIGVRQSSNSPDEYFEKYRVFFEESTDNISVDRVFLDQLFVAYGDGQAQIINTVSGRDLKEYAAILIRGTGLSEQLDVVKAVSCYARQHGIRCVNDYQSAYSRSKLAQAVQFIGQGLPVARTILLNAAALSHPELLAIEFPCIVKATMGSHGADNYLVESWEQLAGIVQEQPDIVYVAQRYVPNDGDLRVLLIGDEVTVIGRQASDGSHLNNTSMGGQSTILAPNRLPDGLIDTARKAMETFDATMAGVDIIIDRETHEYFLLEVNRQPQVMTGAAVNEKQAMLGRFFDSL